MVRRHALNLWRLPALAFVPDEIVERFRKQFHRSETPLLYRAPGRVNLIGEHTDYNLGYVFPIALQMACYVAIAPASHGNLRVYSRDFDKEFSIPIAGIAAAQPSKQWSDYILGVAQELTKAGFPIAPCDMLVASEVPTGAGLSSSAALEIATAVALLGGRPFPKVELAKLGQRAESQFVGMPCGIMDQYAAVFGHAGAALKIDCRSLGHEYVELPANVRIIAVNSLVKHELGTSAYRERVAECAQAVAALREIDPKIESLRDVSLDFFERVQDSVPLVPRRRARHIISDTQRVVDLAAAARAHDLREMGRLFVASHRSMQYDYEISCEEIDFLVDTAIQIPGVYGSRMTGGGFGGCTVNLVAPEAVDRFRHRLIAAYQERYQKTPAFYDCQPAEGAGPL
jgi:galactokinase